MVGAVTPADVKAFVRSRLTPSAYLGLRRAYLRAQRIARPPQLPSQGTIRLHLGCGSVNHPAFINVDIEPEPHVHFVRAIDDLSPFRTGTVDLVYASHCLEHFSHRDVPRVLREWHRVLRPGGTLRLSVPDFDRLLSIYRASSNDLNAILGILMGGQDSRYNFHKTAFNRAYLENLLRETGFRATALWTPGSSELTSLADTAAVMVEVGGKAHSYSLNLEATK
jgi:predicted SAM-dependent methyltransferase